MRVTLERIAAGAAGLAALLSFAAMLGYVFHAASLYTVRPPFQGMSPLTAAALLCLSATALLRFVGRRRAIGGLAMAAAAIALAVLAAYAVAGDDVVSIGVARALFGPVATPGRTSVGTALAIVLLAIAASPAARERPRISDTAAAIAVLLAALALLGYAYGAADLYALRLFHTMGLNTAVAIFALGIASVLGQADGGWAHAIMLKGDAGRATRRQLLFTLIPPVVGYFLVDAATRGTLRLGAAMALFVVLTVAPLIWLVLRDGRALAQLDQERRDRQAQDADHRAALEDRLAAQAHELAAANADRLSLLEAASARSQNRYRQLYESIDAGFCIVEMRLDANDRPVDYFFIEVNDAFERNTGLADAEGHTIRELAPDIEQHWIDVYDDVARRQQPTRFDLPAKSLGDRWYDVHAFPVDDPTLRRVGILFNDVTDRKRAQTELEQLNAGLEQRIAEAIEEQQQAQAALRQSQKMEAMGQLTGGVAHDFNNLLTPIIGSLDLISRRPSNSDREKRLIDGALQSADRAKVLVQRLLAFARRQPLQPGPVDVGAVLQAIGELASSTLGSQVSVFVRAPDDLPPALADANQLEMAILNLSVNARDAMPDGGSLTIAARVATADDARPDGLAAGDYVIVSVSDTGLGMDSETLRRATEPFYSTKGIGKGTGLGLSMVHGLAAQLNGALDIHSEVGAGTRIDLWLPLAATAPAAAAIEPIVAPVSPRRGGRVLLVDDEAIVRLATAAMLQDIGYDVVEASSAGDALSLLGGGLSADLLVTDHLMPGMTGADLARAVGAGWPGMPILLISGYADVDDIAPGLPRLAKPFRQTQLAKALADIA